MTPYAKEPFGKAVKGRSVRRSKDRWDIAMTPDKFQQFLDCVKKKPANRRLAERDYFIFVLMGNLGLRIGEAVRVKLKDLDHLADPVPMAHVVALKKREREKDPKTGKKTGKKLTVYKDLFIHPKVADAVRRYVKGLNWSPNDYLFPGMTGDGHIGERMVEQVFYSYCKACGFTENYSSHAIRHMYGTLVADKTNHPAFIRDQLGHASVAGMGVTNNYMHVSMEKGKELINLVGYFL